MNLKNTFPTIAVTMGDPAGIGPEIVAKAWEQTTLPQRPIIIGDPEILTEVVEDLGLSYSIKSLDTIEQASFSQEQMEVLVVRERLGKIKPGAVDAHCGQAAFDYIAAAIRLAMEGHIQGIATAPIHKEAFAAANIHYPGHTEVLADLSGSPEIAMMLVNEDLRVVLVTIHCSLREAIERANFEAQVKTIQLAHKNALKFGIKHPKVAVAGLNPHAGEGGLFGCEEIEIIKPAIETAQKQGIDVSGPWPGDTVFMNARKGKFDIVVAQYHDQGLIPIKTLGFETGVNITLGLPFVRTSPDHGTAFDIVGQGIANPSSLLSAITLADQLITNQIPKEAPCR